MQTFCPLCMKSGVQNRIKAFQINLEEAVFACSGEKCVWPFGYEDLRLLERDAITYDWLESDLPKENMLMSIELSFYTPPITPGSIEFSSGKELSDGVIVENSIDSSIEDKIEMLLKEEFICSKEEFVSLDNGQVFDLFELQNELTEKSMDITKQGNTSVNSFKVQPKIIDIQKTNIDLTILPSDEYGCHNEKSQKLRQSPTDTNNITDIIKNCDILLDNTLCNDLSVQCEIESEQNKNSIIQLDNMTDCVEKFSSQTMLEATQSPIDSSMSFSDSILNTSKCDVNIDDIDAFLEDIINENI